MSKISEDVVSVDITITTSPDASIAIITQWNGLEVANEWSGTAKKMPGDKFNPTIGAKLALGRAFESAGKQLIRQGNGLVKNAEDNRLDSKRKREAAAKAKANNDTVKFPVVREAPKRATKKAAVKKAAAKKTT